MAFTSFTQGISTGSPVLSTTIVFALALATASINASWFGAKEFTRSVLATPLSSANTIAILADLAAAIAALTVSPSFDQASLKVTGCVTGSVAAASMG